MKKLLVIINMKGALLSFIFTLLFSLFTCLSSAQIISTIAGNGIGGFSGNGGPATAAEIGPAVITVDKIGNIYVSDYSTRVRKINTSGIINAFAGNGDWGYSGDGGPATAAEIEIPAGIALDDSGNIYIADNYNYVVRKVNTSGIISTFAGNGYHPIGGSGGYSGDGGPATAAELYRPTDIAVDKSGNVYICDSWNNVIRKVNTSGIISTFAGNGYGAGSLTGNGGFSGDGGLATAAEFYNPDGMAVDDSGNVYIADAANSRIRKVNSADTISTIAGNGFQGFTGDGGPATNAEIATLTTVKVDDSGNFYLPVAGYNRVRKVQASGIINTIAGIGIAGYSGDGGPATAAELYNPNFVAIDTNNNIYIADNANAVIRKIWEVLNVFANVTSNITCNGTNNGIATVSASEGVSPYTYSWSPNGGSNAMATGLSAGSYTVFVTDSNNIKGSATITITQPPVLIVSGSAITNVICNGGNGGSASATINGGVSPYNYLWSDVNNQTTISASGLIAGTYTATITDYNGCSIVSTVTITQPAAIAMTADSVNVTGTCNGSAWAIVTGGTPSYSYLWTGGLTTDTISNQCTGNYCSIVTDANGCIDSVCVNIDISTGTEELIFNNEPLTIYPNPSDGLFMVVCHSERSEESLPIIEVYNVLGEKVFTSTLPPPKGGGVTFAFQLNISSQPNGIYLYRVLKEDGSLVGEGKVIIQK